MAGTVPGVALRGRCGCTELKRGRTVARVINQNSCTLACIFFFFLSVQERLVLYKNISFNAKELAEHLSLRRYSMWVPGADDADAHANDSAAATCAADGAASVAPAAAAGGNVSGSGSEGQGQGSCRFAFDPRYVVFEYLFNVVLREQQVRLVRTFVAAHARNQSQVQQLIMGAGKTTVIGPLLSLILADGQQLVMQVGFERI